MLLPEIGQQDGLERGNAENPAPATFLLPCVCDFIGYLFQKALHVASAYGDLRLDRVAVSQPQAVHIRVDRQCTFRHLQRIGHGDADHRTVLPPVVLMPLPVSYGSAIYFFGGPYFFAFPVIGDLHIPLMLRARVDI